jgi:hypothetical protein
VISQDASTGIGPLTRTVTNGVDSISVNLIEGTSGTYSGTIDFCDSGSFPGCNDDSTNTLEVDGGNYFTISGGGAPKTSGFISPLGTTHGAVAVTCTVLNCGTITLDYGSGAATTTKTLDLMAAGGGGGGGISRAGLVVQAVGAIALFGGGSSTSGPPSFDDTSFTLSKGFGGVLSDSTLPDDTTAKLEVGKKSDISMGFKMPGGLNDLDHIGLYANIGPEEDKYDSDTYIYFDRFKTPQITIRDPHGFFKSVNVDVTEPTKSNIDVNFVFDFAKSLDNSNVVFEAWNIKRDGAIKEIPGLLKVDDPTKPEVAPETTETITPTTEERPPVPEWVKSNAAWWGKGEIDDNEFTNGIGYLIQNKIINVPGLMQKNTSPEKVVNPDTGIVEPEEEFIPVVPDWVKNNAVWWSEGQLTDDDFLVGIQYLLEKGIIQVRV